MEGIEIRKVNDKSVITFTRSFCNANTLEVEIGTFDGQTYMRFSDLGSTNMVPHISKEGPLGASFEVSFCGDSEVECLKDSLRFMLRVLDFQLNSRKQADYIIGGPSDPLPFENEIPI